MTLDSVYASFHLLPCGSMPLSQDLRKKEPCPLAVHLAPFAEWLVRKGKSRDTCLKDLAARQDCMTSTAQWVIDVSGLPIAGDPKAPVLIAVYISALCPLCTYLSSEVFQAVTDGALKGKARFAAKPFTQSAGDCALLAAAQMKKFWEFFAALHAIKTRPDEPVLIKVADSLGMPQEGFRNLLNSKDLKEKLLGFREEGTRNGVTITPTIFINGRRYHSYKDPRWVVDAALYEYEESKKR